MIGIVIVTHGGLGTEMLTAVGHIVGPLAQAEAIGMGPDDDMDRCRDRIVEAVRTVDSGRGVVVLTDMFGGTPSNLALSVMTTGKVVVLAGANLPMLIRLAGVRSSKDLVEAAHEAEAAGHKYIQVVAEDLIHTRAQKEDVE